MFVNWIQTYSYTPGKGTGGSDFTPLWRDDLSSADGSRWYWANWTFDAAINDYIPQNSTTRNGYLVQVLTADTATGQFPTPPVDDGSVAQPPPPVISNPVALPARIEAEDYHRFVDTSGGNYGDAVCSNTDVDAQLTSDPTGGRCNVGWTAPGEWLEYDVSTASAAAYNLSLRVASDSIGPAMHVEIDGANVSGQLSVPSNGWQSFADLLTGPFMLSAGNHIVRLVFDTGNVNINYLVFNPPDAGTSLPATIQAESPNRFYDTSAANDGDAVCGKGALDVQVTDDAGGGGCAVAYVAPGEWLEYNVTSPQARTYDLTVRISSGMSGQTLHVEIDGHTIAGGSVVSPANGWQSFSDALIANVALAAGPHTVRLVFDTGYINADYLTFAAHSGG
jgi:sarcosine oxidase gamma subunit